MFPVVNIAFFAVIGVCTYLSERKKEKMKDELFSLNTKLLKAQAEKIEAETKAIQLNSEKSDTSES